ncbi:MAG: thioesterase [Bryobacteraceae bacterium]|jgi:predicted thioesterase
MNDVPVETCWAQPLLVTPRRAIGFPCLREAPVLSTPRLIECLGNTACDASQPYLAEGYASVGTEIHVRRLAPAPVGNAVRFTARATAVEGPRVRFQIQAREERKVVAEGTLERLVIQVARFATRLAAKRTQS